MCVYCVCVCSQVALDVTEELCYELALQRPEAMNEYAIFLVTNRGTRADISPRVCDGTSVLIAAVTCARPGASLDCLNSGPRGLQART